jgi:4-hydroxy-tetrahydrodipicolinate reductase
MGRAVAELALQDPTVHLVGGLLRTRRAPGDLEAVPPGVQLTTDPASLLPEADVLIDFTAPEATLQYARACASHRCAFLTGTTGLDPGHLEELRVVAAHVPVLHASNFSLGIALLRVFLSVLARALPDWDVEIVEQHHRYKRDAPSGTALLLAASIRSARQEVASEIVSGRRGIAPRQPGEIGIHAVRAGGEVGYHKVLFASQDELLSLSHRVYSRRAYAVGAVAAAKLLAGRSPGWYRIDELLFPTLGQLA